MELAKLDGFKIVYTDSEKKLSFIEVLGNLQPHRLDKIFEKRSPNLQYAIDLATAIVDGDIQQIETLGLPKPKKPKVEIMPSAISTLLKKPLKLPNKAHSIYDADSVKSNEIAAPSKAGPTDAKIKCALEA